MKYIFLSVILFILNFSFAHSSGILAEKETVNEIKRGLAHVYNYEFEQSEHYFAKVHAKHPTSPAYSLLKAIRMNIEFPELVADKSVHYKTFEAHIEKAISLSDKILKDNPNDYEGIFFKLNALSLSGLKHAQAQNYTKALSYAKSAYDYIKQAMIHKETFHEFYFSSGLYNYYVVQYPQSHVIVKPLMFLFQNGDKIEGLKELEYAAQHSTFSSVEANFFLSNVYFKYENNVAMASVYAHHLVDKHPKNLFYQFKLCEVSIARKDIKTAFTCIDSISKNKSFFYQAAYWIMTGHYHEVKGETNTHSRAAFTLGLNLMNKHAISSDELKSLAYLGLARCADKEKHHEKAKEYYLQLLPITSNNYYIKEANDYLKKY